MCGRYNLELNDQFTTRFEISDLPKDLKSNYNIAPSQLQPVVLKNSPNRVEIKKWGIIPFWSKDGKDFIINIRAESLTTKPMFKKLFQSNRCLVPATGFYEWKRTKEIKQPYNIRLKSHKYFAFAGVYDGENYAIITTIPNRLMESIHFRMPVILTKENEEIWLNKTNFDEQKLTKTLTPYQTNDMEAYPISLRVNSPFNIDSSLIKPL